MKTYTSLSRKLTVLIAGGGMVSALIAAVGFSWFNFNRYWQHTNAELTAISDVVADQVGPAITLGDLKSAREILSSVRADPLIRDAMLYDVAGGCFAAFHRSTGTGCPGAPRDGIRRELNTLVFGRAVNAGNERLGTLVMAATIPSIPALLGQYLLGAVLIVGLSLAVAGIVAVGLQSRVTTPILEIARVAERIAQTHQFGDRVSVESIDELGVLANSFNAMLDEIERRDAELARHRKSLEEQVSERNRVNAELLLAKEKAEEVASLKSEFLANMSHEIRTPMNGVMGMISLVLDRCSDSEEREQLLAAYSASQSLVTLLNSILDLSKIEAGKMTIELIGFDLRSLLREALQMFAIAAREKSLDLVLNIVPDCPAWVRGDPGRLRQVLINLIGNALKFTPAGSIHVAVGAPSQSMPGQSLLGQDTPGKTMVRFEIRDTGIGVAPDKLKSIFDAFTQADGSHTRRFGGTGLGLTITQRLVNLMAGRIRVESQVGRGSCFCVELPMERCAELPPAAEVRPAITLRAPSSLEVLVAEDNLINQKVISALLRRQGWSITLAGNGEEAYRHFLRSRFDLILMDVQMPEMDGLEATALIRGEETSRRGRGRESRTPIIALTAHTSQSQHLQCLAAGMDLVVTKPVNLQALLRGIQEVMIPADLVVTS
jgi:signal transduction histidine kinase/CheY-like chemotaxis protein